LQNPQGHPWVLGSVCGLQGAGRAPLIAEEVSMGRKPPREVHPWVLGACRSLCPHG